MHCVEIYWETMLVVFIVCQALLGYSMLWSFFFFFAWNTWNYTNNLYKEYKKWYNYLREKKKKKKKKTGPFICLKAFHHYLTLKFDSFMNIW